MMRKDRKFDEGIDERAWSDFGIFRVILGSVFP
jgi:hypothetical protein